MNPVQNCVWSCGFELADMENRMYCSELIWKSESERCVSYLGDDFERTEVLLR